MVPTNILNDKFHNEIITRKFTILLLFQHLKLSEYKMSDIKQKIANRVIILLMVLDFFLTWIN